MDCKVCLVLDEVYQPMRCVGSTGHTYKHEELDNNGHVIATGLKHTNIYQCARCKSIDIE